MICHSRVNMKIPQIFLSFGVIYFVICNSESECLEIKSLKINPPVVIACLTTQIICETVGSNPEVWWTLNGHNVSNSSSIALYSNEDAKQWTLELKCPQTDQPGEVTCHAMLPDKLITYKNRSIALKVFSLTPKAHLKVERFVLIRPNSEAILKCTLSSDQNLSLVIVNDFGWYRNGQQLSRQETHGNHSKETQMLLKIPRVSENETGFYTCQAKFVYKVLHAHTAVLLTDGLAPTRLNIRILNQGSPPSALLNWHPPQLPKPSGLAGAQDIDISQYKVTLKFSNQTLTRTMMAKDTNVPPWNSPIMIWANLTENNLYTFMISACLSHKKCGDYSDPVTVAIFEDFARPENLTVVCRYDNISFESFIDVAWDPPLDAQEYSLTYKVEISGLALFRDSQGDMRLDTENNEFDSSRTWRRHLVKSNTNYTVKVCVITSSGCGQYSAAASCSTPPSVPSELPPFELHNVDSSAETVKLKLELFRIPERYGPIRCYRVILYKMRPSQLEIPIAASVVISTYEDVHREGAFGAYVAEAFNSEHFKSEVLLGDEQQSNCQEEYVDPRHYRRKKRNVSDSEDLMTPQETTSAMDPMFLVYDGKLEPNTRYSGFIEIMVMAPNGKELKRRSPMFQPTRTHTNANYGTTLPTALGVICGLFSVILILTIALCVLRRKTTARGQAGTPILPQPCTKPIKKENLAAAYVERHKDSDLLFQREYELLPEFYKDRTSKASDNVENFFKNRYPDIKAYDQTRVKLAPLPGIAGSDYINANYVQGYKNRKKFICAQGPLDKTVNDFWRMIWEHKIGIIAMVTGLEENCKTKCAKYWPDEGDSTYGDIAVTITEEVVHGEYAVRRFTVKGPNPSESNSFEAMRVTQFHYLAWKDFLAPDHPNGILKFIKRIHEAYSITKGYLLVHCSAGVGRTGTLVTIDSLLEQMQEEGHIDVFHFVSSIRRYRNFLVQSLTQYIFIYHALMEYAQFSDTEVEAKNLATHLERLEKVVEVVEVDKYLLMKEFEKLDEVIEDYKTTDIGNMDLNMIKNRYDHIVPFDRNRVVLTPVGTIEQSTYINASIIQGYDRSASYIITQDPLECTIKEFWRMILEHCVPVAVMLSEIGDERFTCPKYWPDGEESYDHISVVFMQSETSTHYIVRKFTVTNTKSSKSHMLTHFQLIGWGGEIGTIPASSSGILCLIDRVHSMHELDPNKEAIAIHCSGGGDRSSIFAALSILVQQVTSEKRVDVFQVVRNLRTQRKFMIQSLDQYHFCYKAIMDYTRSHNLDN